MKVRVPGKLILSGEHAILYGQPALAMAVNRYVTTTITRELLPQISFDLADLAHHSRLSLHALKHLKDRIKQKYHRFIQGEYSIRQVLHKPFELAQVALGVFAESLQHSLPHGVKVHVHSDIPIGCGMGSSAATILSVMSAISRYLQVSVSDETLFKLALETENMQHGYSSGLDLRVAMQGGCVFMQHGQLQPRALPMVNMYLVNTGTPATSTGECVEKVAPLFQQSQLGADFSAVTRALDAALQQSLQSDMYIAIRQNHRLLVDIGVVPATVQQFITAVETADGAAKICGAGAVAGEQGGVVLVMMEDSSMLQTICQRFNYKPELVSGESRGIYAV